MNYVLVCSVAFPLTYVCVSWRGREHSPDVDEYSLNHFGNMF